MIVTILETPVYILMAPHGDEPNPWWLSAGALEYLRKYTSYEPHICHHISNYLVNRFIQMGDLRPLSKAPKTGTWESHIHRELPPWSEIS